MDILLSIFAFLTIFIFPIINLILNYKIYKNFVKKDNSSSILQDILKNKEGRHKGVFWYV